jgi:uncharacterized protein (DUF1501 family)
MKRRDFIRNTAAASAPLLLNGFSVSAKPGNALLEMIAQQAAQNERVLILIQLNGGNDGLNTVIPLDQYSLLAAARPQIVIPQNRVLPLNGNATGLHPSMSEVKTMWDTNLVHIVQGVSYPNPNFSHFRSTDIWFTASESSQYLNTGWLGRTMQAQFETYPNGYPNAAMTDPLAIQIGSQASIVTQTNTVNAAITVSDPNAFYNLINGIADPAPNTPYGHELTFLRLIKQQTNAYTSVIKSAYAAGNNQGLYPGNNYLADQLKIVARLIKGGLKTPVYVVNHPWSFDTHGGQVETGDTTTGWHAGALSILSKAVKSFHDDLKQLGVADRVTSMTFTEFGRRVKSNGSIGTDHGEGVPVMFFGNNVNPAFTGVNPTIPANAKWDDNVPMQYDFRSVYYTVLKDWFQLTQTQLNSVLYTTYPVLPIFKNALNPVDILSFTGVWKETKITLTWQVNNETKVQRYEVEKSTSPTTGFVKIASVNGLNTAGPHSYNHDDTNIAQTIYYYRLKIYDVTGAFKYSDIITLRKNAPVKGMFIKVYPNPVRDQFTISFEDKVTGPLTVRLLNSNGGEVWRGEKDLQAQYDVPFSLTGRRFGPGLYVLQVTAGGNEGVVKVVVQ